LRAKRSNLAVYNRLKNRDCFVAALLAMTVIVIVLNFFTPSEQLLRFSIFDFAVSV